MPRMVATSAHPARIADFTGAYQRPRSDTLATAQREATRDQNERTATGAIYRRIGVEPIINGATTMTYLGGSLMPPEVVEAMRQASEASST